MITLTWWQYAAVNIAIFAGLALLYRHYGIRAGKKFSSWIYGLIENAKKEIEKLEKEFAEAQDSSNELRKFEISQRIYGLKKGNDLL